MGTRLDFHQRSRGGDRPADRFGGSVAGVVAYPTAHAGAMTDRVLVGVVLGLVAIAAGFIVPWVLDDTPPFVFGTATAIPDSGAPGASVKTNYVVNVVRGQDKCWVDAERAWVDSQGRGAPPAPMHLPYDAGANVIGLTMNIPADAAPGSAAIANEIQWSCNPWQRLFPQHEPMPPLSVTVVRP